MKAPHPHYSKPDEQCEGGSYKGLGGLFCIRCGHLYRELSNAEMDSELPDGRLPESLT